MEPGASETQVLRFRIGERTTTGTGQVKVVLKGGYAQRDADKGNNVAKIAVRVAGTDDGRGRSADRPSADRSSVGLSWGLAAGVGGVCAFALAAAVFYGVRRSRRRD